MRKSNKTAKNRKAKSNKIAKMRRTAKSDNVAFVRNLRTNIDYEIDLENDDIEERMEEITEGWKHDYEIVDIMSDIDYYKEYMNYEDLITIQGILNDNPDIETINAYLNTRSEDLEAAHNASFDVNVIKAESEEDLGYVWVDAIEGGIENLSRETLESYFDYESYGRDLAIYADYYEGKYYFWD